MDAPRGTVIVRARALEHTFGALAARALGVTPRDVGVRIADDRGLVTIDIRSPYAGPESVVAAAQTARRIVREEGAAITGAEIGAVAVRITDITISTTRRLA